MLDAVKDAHVFTSLMAGLCNVSTFWLTYQMQQNLSAATDITQLLPLAIGWFQRRFTHPTPRQLIELSEPPPLDYANYYNNYLFVATVGFCFGVLQPIIFPITAFYFLIELWFKRYLLQYVLVTKIESGGVFWNTLVNRMLFSTLLGNAVVALIVGAQGVGAYDVIQYSAGNAAMLYAMIPLPFLVGGFKWYCLYHFDDKMRYYSTSSSSNIEKEDWAQLKELRNDRVAVRFGHPALYIKLLTPMVDAKSEHLLKAIISDDMRKGSADATATASSKFGYSDTFMSEADHARHAVRAPQTFELVPEEEMNFEHFKERTEFGYKHGRNMELYGTPRNLVTRAGAPSTFQALTKGIGEKRRLDNEDEFGEVDLQEDAHEAAGALPPLPSCTHFGRESAASVDI